jgi:hypothetical protein
LGESEELGHGIRRDADSQEGKGSGTVAVLTSESIPQVFKLSDDLLDGLKVRSEEENIIYIRDEDHASSVVHSRVKIRHTEVKLMKALLEMVVPGPRRLDKSIERLVQLKNNTILVAVVIFVTEHLGDFNVDFLIQRGLDESAREINVPGSPSVLESKVHHNADRRPGGYRSVALKVVDSCDLLVTTDAVASLVLAHASIWVSLDLECPGPGEQIGSGWH